eukprot:CAMPEP_0180545964 /NCGR_PEP_ID=MMETSP1036_2-20121128/70315_1 /TAXON_ID=632150 /ORGANISM="Azadinium spinosum, Strain 3D9" /LENGTH=75 /DNA_ID=CAMNT_0022561031 /DNA_START=137 /DNA_END=364 /DNA_ORIENTATION=-
MSGSRSMGIILVLGAIFTSPRMVFSLSFCLNKFHMAVGGLDVAEAYPRPSELHSLTFCPERRQGCEKVFAQSTYR